MLKTSAEKGLEFKFRQVIITYRTSRTRCC